MGNVRGIVKLKGSNEVVFDYHPKEFPISPGKSANQFVSQQDFKKTDFKISELVAKQAGIQELERRSLDNRVEQLALEQMKAVEERAYKEAYELGQIDGAEKAFQEHKEEFTQRLKDLDVVLKSFEDLKANLMVQNEAQIVKLSYQIGKKIALTEIEEKPELIVEMLKNILESIQTDERILVKVAAADLSFIEGLREKMKKEWDVLKRVKVEAADDLSRGGCLVETNYGSIDASLEERLEKAWAILAPKIPKNKGPSDAESA